MESTAEAYEGLLQRFVGWAVGEPGIRGVVVIGSRARTDHPADEWSDMDVVVVTSDPDAFAARTDWIREVGEPLLSFLEPTADGRGRERRVLFAGGYDVDFALFSGSAIRQLADAGVPADVKDVFRRGYRIVLDKDGSLGRLADLSASVDPYQPPGQEEFLNRVSDFWYHAVWTAKHLRRGEIWWAKGSCDSHMKELLRILLQWHARVRMGQEHDTWLRGRFLEQWADPPAVAELRNAFAHYDAEDIWRALLATMNLFRRIATETASGLGYPYPKEEDRQATALVEAMHTNRPPL